MKAIVLFFMIFSIIGCASYRDREPSSEETQIKRGMSTDYYGPR